MGIWRTLGMITATTALSLGGAAAYAGAHADKGGRRVDSVTGSVKGGFVKTYSTGETVTYPPFRQEQRRCWNLGGGETTEYCLGILDGQYPLLTEFRDALETLEAE